MNIFSISRSLSLILVCICAISCGQSEDQEAVTTTTNATTTESTLGNANITSSTNIQDIWVLDSINNIAPDSNYFSHGTPYFDFNLDKKTISGHTGCNGLNGKVNVQDNKLTFDSLDVAKDVCKDKGFEKKLLKAFKNGVSYTVSNDKMYMNIEPGTVYIFRRIRR